MAVIYKVLSAMDIEAQRQESIARNLAGAPIPGFKGENVISSDFDGYLNQYSVSGQGSVFESNNINFEAGPLKHTGRVLDFAIANEGFFEVTNANGDVMYTRNGRFTLSPDGTLLSTEGYTVSAKSGNLQFDNDADMNKLRVTHNGKITLDGDEVGTLKIVEVADVKNLERISSSYFRLKEGHRNEATTMEDDKINIVGRSLEESNISIVKEMISMIDTMRKYEMSSKVLKMTDGLRTKELSTFGS